VPALPGAHFPLEGRWLSALPAAVLDALPVDLLFSTFDAALLVTFPPGTDDHLLRARTLNYSRSSSRNSGTYSKTHYGP
jgi:hypothetical protein